MFLILTNVVRIRNIWLGYVTMASNVAKQTHKHMYTLNNDIYNVMYFIYVFLLLLKQGSWCTQRKSKHPERPQTSLNQEPSCCEVEPGKKPASAERIYSQV